MNRRQFLRLSSGLAVGAIVSGCASDDTVPQAGPSPRPSSTAPPAPSASSGPVRPFTLTARTSTVDLGGVQVPTWTYGEGVPGAEIRVGRGETLEVRLRNELPVDTSVHWHGLTLPNTMDGVPGITQPPVGAGGEFLYRFAADVPGTYWLHPHTGLQLERGLYAPLIIEDPSDGDTYDEEWVVVLDDWLDGVGDATPESMYDELRAGMGGGHAGHMDMNGPARSASPAASANPSAGPGGPRMLMGASSALLGGDAGDVAYPHYLINGRTPADPRTFRGRAGQRVRIRMINAGGDTAFRVAVGGHRMKVTHTDGIPVQPVTVDAILIGMGERYDVEITLKDGAFPLAALAEGKNQLARALIRTSDQASAPPAGARPDELNRAVLRYDQLAAAEGHALARRSVDREHRVELTGTMGAYNWSINGKPFDAAQPFAVSRGERVRLAIANNSMMWHPMHLHGHTFQLNGAGPRKDTVAVPPGESVSCDFDADQPGTWMIHCHNSFHLEAGMMASLAYTD